MTTADSLVITFIAVLFLSARPTAVNAQNNAGDIAVDNVSIDGLLESIRQR